MTTVIAIPKCARVTPLEHKLPTIPTDELPADWYRRAVDVLRGGDGGEHGQLLFKLVLALTGKSSSFVALDVGTARGFSAMVMARAITSAGVPGTIYSVDVVDHEDKIGWHGKKHDADDPLNGQLLARAEIWKRWFLGDISSVVPVQGRSVDVLKDWDHGPIDLAFLDGSHEYSDVSQELAWLDELVTEGGMIVLDDYHVGEVVGRVRSRLINVAAWLIGRSFGRVLPQVRDVSPRLGEGNEYRLIKQRFSGVRRAADEFVHRVAGRWSMEIVPMPVRGSYQGGDYSVAILSRHRSVDELGSIGSGE